jgi:hypothetical protein
MSIKGSFVWGTNVRPEYVWFNGTASHYLLGDRFDPSRPLAINELKGSYDDPDAKIYPIKVHRGRQIYDTVNHYLVQPKLASSRPGDGAYWAEFDWQRAATEGMREVSLPYSGGFGFARTEMSWPVNHMVAPKAEAVSCSECHTRSGGRLAHVDGFYLPGRDRNPRVDYAGGGLVLLTMVAVVLHGGGRVVASRRRKRVRA